MLKEILSILPLSLSEEISRVGTNTGINEIRLRVSRRVIVVTSNVEIMLNYVVSLKDLLDILVRISKNSIYAIQNDINSGFVTIRGGHRIGICGEAVLQDGKIKNIKNINSMNIRVARQVLGCADKIMPYVINNSCFLNTLIISPPGCGKTTMLRDAIRQLSNGIPELDFKGKNVGLVDERGEIAAINNGKYNLDVGIRTDVLSNCPKSIGIEMLIRSMGVELIATDEIGSNKDIEAIKHAALSGVRLIFTAHGSSVDEISQKEGLSYLVSHNFFETLVVLSNRNGPGTIENIQKISKLNKEVV